ncbi:MAG: acetyl-CoA carboxylase biotin carboxyl carrier protein subunit [Bdellovibrionales bacterium]
MFFEADLKNRKYKIEVFETPTHWKVTLQQEDKDIEYHHISKIDYQKMDDAISFIFQNVSYMVDVVSSGVESIVYTRGSFRQITLYNDELLLHESLKGAGALSGEAQITSGMPGKIVKVNVRAGDKVSAGQTLVVMEAMKMENDLKAPRDVTVKEVLIKEGQSIESGTTLVTFEQTEK